MFLQVELLLKLFIARCTEKQQTYSKGTKLFSLIRAAPTQQLTVTDEGKKSTE